MKIFQSMRKNIKSWALVALTLSACTDLEVKEIDSVVVKKEGTFVGVPMPSSLQAAYANLRGQSGHENVYAIQEATTDELFIPTRGTDWGDNGVWRDLATHQWSPAHLFNRNAWNELNSNVYRLNLILDPRTTTNDLEKAEAKFLRAYNMYFIFDIWRQVPFRTADEDASVNPKVFTPQDAFDLIEQDLTEAIPDLPATAPSAETRFASQAAANYLLAKLYLNKHIYLGGAVQAADMQKVIDLVDEITDDGFELYNGYFDIFKPDVDSETILWTDASVGNRIWSTLHYASGSGTDNPGGGWNGFATTAEFYDLFEGDPNLNTPGSGQEERRGAVALNGLGRGLLIGQQYAADGTELMARGGKKLAFTKSVPSLTGNSDITGIRVIKYHPNDGGSFRSHFILFRYADAYLMKAEALLRNSQAAAATTLVNDLRSIRGADPLAGTLTEQQLLDERGRELYTEGWRRSDLIRFGKYNQPYGFNDVTEDFRSLMPIPDLAVASNPNLKQNPGY